MWLPLYHLDFLIHLKNYLTCWCVVLQRLCISALIFYVHCSVPQARIFEIATCKVTDKFKTNKLLALASLFHLFRFIANFTCGILQVDWDAERECFETFSREISSFYAMKKSLFTTTGSDTDQSMEVLEILTCFL